jgi:hypothetical protein
MGSPEAGQHGSSGTKNLQPVKDMAQAALEVSQRQLH